MSFAFEEDQGSALRGFQISLQFCGFETIALVAMTARDLIPQKRRPVLHFLKPQPLPPYAHSTYRQSRDG